MSEKFLTLELAEKLTDKLNPTTSDLEAMVDYYENNLVVVNESRFVIEKISGVQGYNLPESSTVFSKKLNSYFLWVDGAWSVKVIVENEKKQKRQFYLYYGSVFSMGCRNYRSENFSPYRIMKRDEATCKRFYHNDFLELGKFCVNAKEILEKIDEKVEYFAKSEIAKLKASGAYCFKSDY